MLSNSNLKVRSAACQCAKALSRSVGVLRTHLIEAGAARPLFALLQDEKLGETTIAVEKELLAYV